MLYKLHFTSETARQNLRHMLRAEWENLDFGLANSCMIFFMLLQSETFFAKIFKNCADKKYLTFLEASVVAAFLRSSALLAVE